MAILHMKRVIRKKFGRKRRLFDILLKILAGILKNLFEGARPYRRSEQIWVELNRMMPLSIIRSDQHNHQVSCHVSLCWINLVDG